MRESNVLDGAFLSRTLNIIGKIDVSWKLLIIVHELQSVSETQPLKYFH